MSLIHHIVSKNLCSFCRGNFVWGIITFRKKSSLLNVTLNENGYNHIPFKSDQLSTRSAVKKFGKTSNFSSSCAAFHKLSSIKFFFMSPSNRGFLLVMVQVYQSRTLTNCKGITYWGFCYAFSALYSRSREEKPILSCSRMGGDVFSGLTGPI